MATKLSYSVYISQIIMQFLNLLAYLWKDDSLQTNNLFSHTIIVNDSGLKYLYYFSSVQFIQFSRSIVSESFDHKDCSTLVLPVHRQLQKFTQTHVHRVGDAIQPSHPLSSSSPSAPNPSQHQESFPMSQLFT